jgi:hypothetical protein
VNISTNINERYTVMTILRRTTRLWLCFGAVVLFAACEQPLPGAIQPGVPVGGGAEFSVMIATDAPSYRSGDRVSIRLVNHIGRPVGYNLCESALEHDQEGSWRVVQATLVETCTKELRVLGAGQAAFYAFRAEPRIRPGRYRIRTTLQDLDRRTANYVVVSNTFAMTREGSD